MSITVSVTFSDEAEGRAFASSIASPGRVIFCPAEGDVPWEELWPGLESVQAITVMQQKDLVAQHTTGHLSVAWPLYPASPATPAPPAKPQT